MTIVIHEPRVSFRLNLGLLIFIVINYFTIIFFFDGTKFD